MPSNTEIANLALSHLGIGKEIANLDSDKSEEAVAIRRFFATARDATLRDFPWPFARKFAEMAKVAEPPPENDEWAFSYRAPADSVFIRRILSGLRNDSHESRVRFLRGQDKQGQLVYTDQRDAKTEYTFRETDPGRFDPDFVLALSFRLAAYAAPKLTAGDPFKLRRDAFTIYAQEISMAQSNAANEAVPDKVVEAEGIRQRDADTFTPPGGGGGRPFGFQP